MNTARQDLRASCRLTVGYLLCHVFLAVGCDAFAADQSKRAAFVPGERVLVISRQAIVRAEDQRQEVHGLGTVFKVRAVQDKTVTVSANTFDGELAISDVIVLHDAGIHLTQAIKTQPSDAHLYYARGMYWSQLNLPEAIADLTRAIELDDRLTAAYIARGRCYSQLAKLEEAQRDFARAIELEPKNFTAYTARAEMWWADGAAAWLEIQLDCLRDLQRAIELEPAYGYAYALRGKYKIEIQIYHYRLDQTLDQSSAVDDVEKALRIHPLSVNALVSMARLNERTQTVAGIHTAGKIYDRVLAIDPFQRAAWANRARDCITLGELNLAAIAAFHTLKTDWRHSKALHRLANLLDQPTVRIAFTEYLIPLDPYERSRGALLLDLDLHRLAEGIDVLEGRPAPDQELLTDEPRDTLPLDVPVKADSLAYYQQCHGYGRPQQGQVWNEAGESALACALRTNGALFSYLLSNSADPNVLSRDGESCLHLACRRGSLASVELLLACGARLDSLTPQQETALEIAISTGQPWTALWLVKNGADLQTRSSQGDTLLKFAIGQGKLPAGSTSQDVRVHWEKSIEESFTTWGLDAVKTAAENRKLAYLTFAMRERMPDGYVVGGLSRREVWENIKQRVDEEFDQKARVADAAKHAANIADQSIVQVLYYADRLLPADRVSAMEAAILAAQKQQPKP